MMLSMHAAVTLTLVMRQTLEQCCRATQAVRFLCLLQLIQTYSQIRGNILAGRYEPVSAFSCQQGHTSYTAADLPTRNQVSEAAYAASQASAGRLAALTSQVPPPYPPCCSMLHIEARPHEPSHPPLHVLLLLHNLHAIPHTTHRYWTPPIDPLTCCSMHHICVCGIRAVTLFHPPQTPFHVLFHAPYYWTPPNNPHMCCTQQ